MNNSGVILTLNAGSSSIKFALFGAVDPLVRSGSGTVQGIGSANPQLKVTGQPARAAALVSDHDSSGALVLTEPARQIGGRRLIAIGHLMDHGGPEFVDPQLVGPGTLVALRQLAPLDPDHMPAELALVGATMRRFPGVPQVVCFDTAFHHAMPRVAKLLAIPLHYAAKGVISYGFHGLAYACLLDELARLEGAVSHSHGTSWQWRQPRGGERRPADDTSMGFTPASGVTMGTAASDHIINFESGLLGLSETSADVRDLLACEALDPRAADAVALF